MIETDDVVEQRLRDDAASWREDRPAGPSLAPLISGLADRGVRRRRPDRRWLPAIAAALIIAVAISAIVALNHRSSTAPTGSRSKADLTSVPPGMRLVPYRGVAISVPQTWQVLPAGCSLPAADSVTLDDGKVRRCPYFPPEGKYSHVALAPDLGASIPPSGPVVDATINGLRTQRWTYPDSSTVRGAVILLILDFHVLVPVVPGPGFDPDTVLTTVRPA
jgi:hypothetical protein